MKRLLGSLFLISAIGIGISCEKDDPNPEYPFTIIVKTFEDSLRVNNVRVEVQAHAIDNVVFFQGFTNEEGRISFKYDKEAVLEVRATRGDIDNPTYVGCNQVRLQANEEVFKTIYIKENDPDVTGGGC